MPNLEQDLERLLNNRPKRWKLLWLPWWYNSNILYYHSNLNKAKRENPPGPFCLTHARLISAYLNDRNYIDIVLRNLKDEATSEHKTAWIQAYFDIGFTLCDLGYSSDGIEYIEKAIELEKRPKQTHLFRLLLGFRLNDRVNWKKRLYIAERLTNEIPDDTNAQGLLAKSHISLGNHKEAEEVLSNLGEKNNKTYNFLWGELYYSKKDYETASEMFEKFNINRRLHFWLEEYDYTKALVYYYTDQEVKYREQALKMKRRLKWDRLYRLDKLDEIEVKKISAIDEIIESEDSDKVLIDTEKAAHDLKAICHITFFYFKKYVLPLLIILGIYLLIFKVL